MGSGARRGEARGERTLTSARADDVAIVLVRTRAQLHGLADRCSHRGWSLHEGRLNDDDTLTCRCHGSTFRLGGSIVKGPATSPQPAFDVRTSDGRVEIRGRNE